MRVFILLLLVAIVGVSIWRGWLTFSRSDGENDSKVGVNVSVDRDKFNKDVNAVKDRLDRDASPKAAAAGTFSGKISNLDSGNSIVTIASPENKQVTVELTADTRVRMGDRPATRAELRQGQEVRCVHAARDGRQLCEEIVILADFE